MHKHVLPQTVNLPSPSVAHRQDGVGGGNKEVLPFKEGVNRVCMSTLHGIVFVYMKAAV